jgi:hypothetical protein
MRSDKLVSAWPECVAKKLVYFLRNISLALRTFLLLAGWLDSESESATSTVVAVL